LIEASKVNYLNWLTVTTTILLTAAPSFAASSQITKVNLAEKKSGLELKLELDQQNNDVASFITFEGEKTLETTILNRELNLAQQKSFQQQNPAPGIAEITLDTSDREHTKITLVKQTDADLKLEPIVKQQGSEIVVSFNKETTHQSLLNKIPFSSNIIDFKNNVTSLVTNKATKDNEKTIPKVANHNQNNDALVPNPEIIISDTSDAVNGETQSENAYEQPYLPRAVAPPVGDMAVSNVGTTPDTVDLGSTAVVPRLVLRDAPVREVLSLLARQAGLSIVFSTNEPVVEGETVPEGEDASAEGPIVSIDLENQSVQEVFDSILLISDLSASRRGNIIYVGTKLPSQARNLISRTIRLNQVRAENAALFLASQGAEGQRLTTEVQETVDPETGRVVQRKELPASLTPLAGEAPTKPDVTSALLLRGLQVATDDRLNAITLVGEPRKVEVATAFITQLDARRRQVAVNLKVIDVNLLNQDVMNSSFSFGIKDTFYTQDNGSAILNFGDTRPPTGAQINSNQFSPAVTPLNLGGAEATPFFDIQRSPYGGVTPGINEFVNEVSPYSRPSFGTLDNPFQPGLSDVNIDPETGQIEYEYSLPSLFQFPKRFLAQLEARITSGNAKILTDPTVVVQEGQESTVKLTQDVIKGVDTNISDNGVTTNRPIYDEAGLTVTVNLERVDDNGFVSLSVSPTVSSIASTQNFDSGNAVNLISLLSRREVSSGLIRLRDGQTLILSGIIQDQERVAATKVPILGDIPLLGSLFRSTNKTNERAEVIVLLTPEIIDEQADFGYNYQPSKETREVLKKGGMDLPNNPEQ
jgi:type IV pilus assembly protein PilQ